MSQQQADAENKQVESMPTVVPKVEPRTGDEVPLTVPANNEYLASELADEKQIIEADQVVKEALSYCAKGKQIISYRGVLWCVLKMSENGHPLQIIGDPKIHLEKFDLDDMNEWTWMAQIKVRNITTGLETIGDAESSFIDIYDKTGKRDIFGRRKAISKAERNAYRKQIPELQIQAMLNAVSGSSNSQVLKQETGNQPTNTQSANTQPANNSNEISPKQQKYYNDLCLKYNIKDTVTPRTKEGMMARISQIKAAHNA